MALKEFLLHIILPLAGPPPAGVGVHPPPPPQAGASHQWWAQVPVPDPVDAPYHGDHGAVAMRPYMPPDCQLTTLGVAEAPGVAFIPLL